MIGRRIKYIRKKKKWSQEMLASKVGMKQVIISRIERGARKVDINELQKIASALEVPISDFLGENYKKVAGE